ncbi:signal peptide peptidase SppA [Patescibacteria group bacterium]|nr:signal peptide peptidase SppA [Patescibacteria group bacterium]MBU4368083.1 signal peptide peptidase SppA [Patescibacteria group bacterium]MBU4462312.1 signal peptide peptidase SppA [Patescibacteria group bacterium]MCG2700361.1 signal peptide peptidase SppA [Candidatus Parcubacteria bacterium]
MAPRKSLKSSRRPKKTRISKLSQLPPLSSELPPVEPPSPPERPFIPSLPLEPLIPKKPLKCHKPPKLLRLIFVSIIVLTVVIFWTQNYLYFLGKETEISKECKGKNIAVINIHGDIVTYGDIDSKGEYLASSNKIVGYLNEADENKKIKAIILDIDSFGGSPVAAEEIANTLKKIKKPTIAVIRGVGDSAAYMIATGAQKIYASRFSEVGSIGITMSYLDYSQQNTSEGVVYQEISSGEFKDMGNPYKELTQEEKELFLNFVQDLKDIFVEMVSVNRNLDILKVREMADGSIMTAKDAKTRGLIDEIGGLEEVKDVLGSELKIKPEVCFIK